MNKFKVGDYIKGNDNSIYGVTDKNMTRAKVTRIISDEDIEIKILKHRDKEEIGHTFEVDEDYFTLIDSFSSDSSFDSSFDSSSESTKITSNFKVGDIIKGINKHKYTWTDTKMTRGEVVEVHNPDIRVKILEHSTRHQIGMIWSAHKGNVNNAFELIERKES